MTHRISRRRALLQISGFLTGLAAPWTGSSLLFAQTAFEMNIKGQEFLTQGKIEQAMKILRKAVSEDARNERSWSLLGRAYAEAGDPAQALSCYRTALSFNPQDGLTRMMVDILKQKPLPRPHIKSRDASRMSELEKAAEAEREAVLSGQDAPKAQADRPWRLVLDPGHGGVDFGCAGQSGIYEKDIALDLGLLTAKALYALCPNVEIYMTRLGDYLVPAFARAMCASLYDADLFVSLHASCSMDSQRSGLGVYSYAPAASNDATGELVLLENQALALNSEKVAGQAKDMAQSLLLRNRKTSIAEKSGKARIRLFEKLPNASPLASLRQGDGPFDILAAVDRPGFVIEIGLLSNASNEAVLQEAKNRESLAASLANALKGAFGCEGRQGEM